MIYCRSARSSKGSILILVFFILVFMSLFSLAVGYAVRQKMQVISRLETRQKLRRIGEAAVRKSIYALLRHKQRHLAFDALKQSWSWNEPEFHAVKVDGGEFSVFYPLERSYDKTGSEEPESRYGLTDEERKLNINRIKSPDIFRRLFLGVGGASTDQARELTEAILDWRDENDDVTSAGAKAARLSRNGNFQTLQELRFVEGMTAELYARILPYVTIESSGLINLNTASRSVLVATGLGPGICDKIIAFRKGQDRREGTADDRAFEDIAFAPQTLANSGYLDDNEAANLEAAVQSGVFTVRSENFSAYGLARMKYKKQGLRVSAIFDEKGVIKHWEEEYVTLPSSLA